MSNTPNYCSHCGASLNPGDTFCPKCGARTSGTSHYATSVARADAPNYTACTTVGFVFMVITTVFVGFAIFPLIWMIPMCVHINHCQANNAKMGLAFKICVLLFGNLISGILLLVDE